MKQDKKGICRGCKKERYFANLTLELCGDCNYKKNHAGKNRFEIAKERKDKKPRVYKKRTIKFSKPTGELTMNREIWEEREHICVNCKIYLGNEPKAWMFAHRKPKSTHPELRLVKLNTELHCWDCHDCLDKQGEEAYNKRTDMYLNI